MNEMEHWEKHFQSWTPRAPSAKVKSRIFNTAPASPAQPARPAWLHSPWLVGAAACLLALALWVMPKTPSSSATLAMGGFIPSSNSLALLCSNTIGFCTSDAGSYRHNNASVNTFDWTNSRQSLTTTGSFPLWKTNIQKL